MAGMGGTPIIILRDTRRESGTEAISNNIMAARAVANAVRSTMGPKGMDKLLVDSIGEVTITNDGVTILKEMDVQHPAAKMLIEAAKTQDKEVGDGTTTVVVLAGELLKRAEVLLDQKVHPTMIVQGYRMAADKAVEIVKSISFEAEESDRALLERIAETAMTGKQGSLLTIRWPAMPLTWSSMPLRTMATKEASTWTGLMWKRRWVRAHWTLRSSKEW